jgi:hypothetical protein
MVLNQNDALSKSELFVTNKGTSKRLDNFEELQTFCDKLLNLDSMWLSPGGGCKSFEIQIKDEDVIIRWYSSNYSVIVIGSKGDPIRNKLKLIAKPLDL